MPVPRHGAAALAVVARTLDKLADPESVAAGVGFPDDPGRRDRPGDAELWSGLSLGGYPGLALAFSGTRATGAGHAERAHACLRAALGVTGDAAEGSGLHQGKGSAAFAVLVAHRATGGYREALGRFDEYHRILVRKALPRPVTEPAATNGEFEVIRGLSGIGRHLLARGAACEPELRAVLSHLVALASGDVVHAGHRVPRWWALATPRKGREREFAAGHLNFGLAHGITGPLALLSLAWRQGVAVEGQREAIENLVGLLEQWAEPDGDGLRWPFHLSLEQWTGGPRALGLSRQRPSWCYGAPGASRAVQLAALALDRPDWHALAHRSLLPLLERPVTDWGLEDAGLCHGTAGLLHILGLLGEHIDDARIPAVRDELAALTLAHYREDHRFGFRTAMTGSPLGADVPGFLEGAAGTALALDAYANGARAHAGWDMALLVN
ncbi:lanthionine synthetase C family protein [Streptomyces huiliensis]|uniref:lanthionine synthetase C family protein n=1 Tax=Streptomyces huiliensis TaxID=2876027 RepID=UPI001CC030C1|nr:lanthionine synthetase C family protein [Streptomyces huiliensis]MBZ4323278.1 lanthionine synthetase C family protein [Streptomyces huiliensis]